MSKKKKKKYVDDGHTIYNMDVSGFKWHDRKVKNKNKIDLSKKEKSAMIRAAFAAYLPKVLIILVGFSLAILLLYFWLKMSK